MKLGKDILSEIVRSHQEQSSTEGAMALNEDISIVNAEQLKILESFNRTTREDDHSYSSIIEMFKKQVHRVPNHIAVVYEEKQYTYQELDKITDKLARKLKTVGVGAEKAVGILIDRSEYMVIYPLAVLKAGGAYMPLDYSFPTDRLEFMIQDAGVEVILSEGNKVTEHIPSFGGKVMNTEELSVIEVDESILLSIPKPHDMFVILYTSGSTGMPKGCILEHGNLVNYCNWHQSYYSVTEGDRAAAYANFGFDAHMLDIYPYITCGASTYIIPSAMRMDFIAINQYFEENQLSIAFMTTQLGRQFVEEFTNKSLRALTVGGEKLLPIKKPTYDFYNAYGPTECTLFTTIYKINSDYDSAIIGSPLDNYQLYVLDSKLQLLPIGASGELCIAGAGVGRGYLNREDVTNEKFIMWNGKRIYRTGDMVRWTNEGEIEYLGRIDGQVKLRGQRIELGEIESQMLTYPGITSCAVTVKEISGAEHLCGYYTAESEIDVKKLATEMATKLTAFMIPTTFTKLDKLPLTSNGKVNKKALPNPVSQREECVAPQNEFEQKLFDLIANILGTEDFGITDDLFSMGLTSILAIKVSVGIYKQFNINVKTNDIFKHKTIEKLAIIINTAETTAIETFAKRDYYPLTENQLGLYYEWEKDREALQYNLPEILKFSKAVDPSRLKDAAVAVIEAHPYLKSYLGERDGQIVQFRKDGEPLAVELKTVRQSEIQQIKDAFTQPFDLFTGPLCRIVIYATEEYTYLFMDIHHIIVDGSALSVFTTDLVAAYQGRTLTPESYTAFEYALESEALVGKERYLAAEQFFDQKIEESMTVLSQGVQGVEVGEAKILITYAPGNQIKKFCKDNAVTPSNVFLSALCTTLNRYTREERIALTTISSGRNENKLHGIMGMFVKTLPIVIHIQPSEKVVDFVKLVQENMFETMEHEIYPFTKMVEKHNCVPQITYAYQGGMLEGFELEGQSVEIESLPLQKVKFPLTISVSPKNDGYEISLEYDDSLYTEDYIRTLSLAVTQCAMHMVENPEKSCKNVVIISKEEQDKILNQFQGAALAYDQNATFVDLFKKQVDKSPEEIAIVDSKSSITYTQTNQYSDCIAKELIRLGIKENNFVGIMLPRCKEFMVSVIGIMKAGAAYLPLDNEYPQDRIAYMMADSEANVLITKRSIYKEKGIQVENVIFIDEFDFNVECNQELPSKAPTGENMAYMIYTSGSTGKPKGVMIRHKSLAAFLAWRINDYQLTAKDHISCHSSFSFDASVYDLFAPLVVGAQLHIISEEMRQNMQELYQYIYKQQIADALFSTQFGMELINQFDIPLKSITLGGEKLKPVKKIDTMLVNAYGPTEFTICSSYHIVDQEKEGDIPIGKPVANSWAYIVDGNNNLMPIGVAGELCLAGVQIALGYWKREELTQEKFIDNPFTTCAENAKMYRTGDLVAWNQEGELEYVGRIDNQIKLRGFRIELGEIESAMTKFPGVTASVAEIKEIGKVQHLCGYFTASIEIDANQLREHLSQSLTEYMVPTAFMQLDKIPLTPNGKVDKKALPALEIERQHEYVPPSNELEEKLCNIFAETLHLDQVGITDSFFELGGTSLLVMKVVVKAMAMNIDLTYANVFKYQKPQELAMFLTNKVEETVTNDVSTYDYRTIDQLLQKNTLGEINLSPIGDILLTGATGFLGIHILKDFLEHYPGKVYCLMRSKDGKSADARLKVRLAYYFEKDYENLFGKRLFTIEGDLNQLVTSNVKVDTVINCAAIVKHFAAGDELEKVNVGGVQKLIDYCVERDALLIQVSTTSVAGTGDSAMKDVKIKESQLYFGQSLDNKYTHSKYLAERYVLAAIEKGLKAKIMRVGNLMPRNSDGEFQINFQGNSFMSSLKAYKLLGKFPVNLMGGEAEFSPIDSTAKAILRLAQTNQEYTVFHPYNNHAIYMSDIIYVMKECGFDIEIVNEGEFEKCLREKMQDEKIMSALTGLLAYEENNTEKPLYALGRTNEFTTEVLYRLQFKWPMSSEIYIEKAIKALIGLGFFDE